MNDTPPEGENKGHTYGISISDFNISGSDTYHVWDFSGDIDSFITHHFFLTTNCTIYLVVADLCKPIEEVRSSISQWLGIIKMHNLGQIQSYDNKEGVDVIKMSLKPRLSPLPSRNRTLSLPSASRFRSRLSSASSTFGPLFKLTRSSASGSSTFYRSPSPSAPIDALDFNTPSVLIEPSMHTVPVIVVGSHFDLVPEANRNDVISQVESCITELSMKFRSSLDVLPQVFPVNCNKAHELKYLKEHISFVRSAKAEVRVF